MPDTPTPPDPDAASGTDGPPTSGAMPPWNAFPAPERAEGWDSPHTTPPTGWGWGPPPGWQAPAPPARPVWHLVVVGLGGLVVGMLIGAGITFAFGMLAGAPSVSSYAAGSAAASAEPGDCLDDDDLASSRPRTIDCDEPHAAEVYARRLAVEGGDAPYPDEIDLEFLGDSLCLAEFEPYAGVNYFDSSDLDYRVFVPNADAWRVGEREVVCAITDYGGGTRTGSAEGAGT